MRRLLMVIILALIATSCSSSPPKTADDLLVQNDVGQEISTKKILEAAKNLTNQHSPIYLLRGNQEWSCIKYGKKVTVNGQTPLPTYCDDESLIITEALLVALALKGAPTVVIWVFEAALVATSRFANEVTAMCAGGYIAHHSMPGFVLPDDIERFKDAFAGGPPTWSYVQHGAEADAAHLPITECSRAYPVDTRLSKSDWPGLPPAGTTRASHYNSL